MATSPNATPTPITPPRVPLIDARTGLIDRAWYLFFLSLFQTAQSGDSTQLGPSAESLIASYDEALRALAQSTETQPPQTDCCDNINALRQEVQTEPASGVAELAQEVSNLRQEVQTLPKPPLGTMAPLQQDNLPWVRFDTTPQSVPETVTGTLYWDDADRSKTLAVVMEDTGQIVQDIGEETFYRVKATSAITKGQVLMFTGTVGASGGLLAAPATGLTIAQSEYILGVATQDIALNSWGYATWFGEIKGVNTTGGAEAWVDGQILYYNPLVAGGLTKTVPTAPNVKVIVAAVVHAASNGILFVRPTFGSTLGDNSNNVEITSVANNDLLVYDGVDQRWENKNSITVTDLTVNGNTVLGDASTDTVRINGYLGVGGAGASNKGIYQRNTALTGSSQYGITAEGTFTSAATTGAVGFASSFATEAAAFTVTAAIGFRAFNVTRGAGSTITNQHGVYIDDQTRGTNNYGITSLVSSGASKWNIYASGTAQNYFAGNVLIGGTAARATTAGTNHLSLFNGTAPVGTLANGISLYSSGGEAYVIDAAGNTTLFSPHDAETNEWIFRSKHTPTGKVLRIDVERMLRFVNDHFGLDAIQEFIEESP